jgi:hypothetical protein
LVGFLSFLFLFLLYFFFFSFPLNFLNTANNAIIPIIGINISENSGMFCCPGVGEPTPPFLYQSAG